MSGFLEFSFFTFLIVLWLGVISCFFIFGLKRYSRTRLVTVTGPSGAGKTTILGELLKRHPEWTLVISLTSREPREGKNLPGEYRCNLSVKYLRQLKKEGKAIWMEEAFGNVYVTLFKDVHEARFRDTLSFMPILHKSVIVLRSYLPGEVLSIFIIPPDEEELRRRFEKRGDSPEQIEKRIVDCHRDLEKARASGIPYHYVKNDGTVKEAVEKVEGIIRQNI